MNKILIANRGEIARRVIDTCRRMGIATVAVFSDPDRHARFVFEADEAVPLGGAAAADSYLKTASIIDAARRTGAEAIHPGYGFLSESAAFATACRDAGLVFIGPRPETITAMGSKIESQRLMAKAGVPVVPSLTLEGVSDDEAAAAAAVLGWPVLVKASAGGGGKGMRIVRSGDELIAALAAGRREAASSFGDDTVYIEGYIESARHVEVQIVGDGHGRVVHVYERECSIQRRYQKIIEESPSPGISSETRRALLDAAVTAGEAVGYEGAGTVEFLVDETGGFYFLEMNTRLQVEHPVTEAVTGLDLVRMQIDVARGEGLPEQAHIPPPTGHAIEARIYAEDPAAGFLPVSGTLHQFHIDGSVRVDAGVYDGAEVGIHYDPLLAKVIAHGRDRTEAARVLSEALAGARLHGLQTNRALLVRVLRDQDFLAGDFDTQFIDRRGVDDLAAPLTGTADAEIHALAAALSDQAVRRSGATVLASIPSGWRNNPSQYQEVTFRRGDAATLVEYRLESGAADARLNGREVRVENLTAAGDHVEVTVDGVHRRYTVSRAGGRHYVDSALGSTDFVEVERFPHAEAPDAAGSLVAPMPGVVRRIDVSPGDYVEAGEVLLVLEAMKMEHNVTAPSAGTVAELRAAAGEQVEAGRVLVVLDAAP